MKRRAQNIGMGTQLVVCVDRYKLNDIAVVKAAAVGGPLE